MSSLVLSVYMNESTSDVKSHLLCETNNPLCLGIKSGGSC